MSVATTYKEGERPFELKLHLPLCSTSCSTARVRPSFDGVVKTPFVGLFSLSCLVLLVESTILFLSSCEVGSDLRQTGTVDVVVLAAAMCATPVGLFLLDCRLYAMLQRPPSSRQSCVLHILSHNDERLQQPMVTYSRTPATGSDPSQQPASYHNPQCARQHPPGAQRLRGSITSSLRKVVTFAAQLR